MAGTTLLALIDDIATLLDDVATMTQVAARKTAGVLGDDLALNAQQVTGVRAERELSVVWAVAQGSMVNKAILVPAALLMTVGVYGLVAGIVKLDDLGLRLQGSGSGFARAVGRGLLRTAPWLMKTLSVVGTAAMFMVGGGILLHGWPALAHAVEAWAAGWGALLGAVINTGAGAAVGVVAGTLVLAVVTVVQRLRR